MSDFDIYGDLPNYNINTTIQTLQDANLNLEQKFEQLQNESKTLSEKIVQLELTHKNLMCNINELYKTAKNELDNKNKCISDLRKQLDDILFNRNNEGSVEKVTPPSTSSNPLVIGEQIHYFWNKPAPIDLSPLDGSKLNRFETRQSSYKTHEPSTVDVCKNSENSDVLKVSTSSNIINKKGPINVQTISSGNLRIKTQETFLEQERKSTNSSFKIRIKPEENTNIINSDLPKSYTPPQPPPVKRSKPSVQMKHLNLDENAQDSHDKFEINSPIKLSKNDENNHGNDTSESGDLIIDIGEKQKVDFQQKVNKPKKKSEISNGNRRILRSSTKMPIENVSVKLSEQPMVQLTHDGAIPELHILDTSQEGKNDLYTLVDAISKTPDNTLTDYELLKADLEMSSLENSTLEKSEIQQTPNNSTTKVWVSSNPKRRRRCRVEFTDID